MIQAHPRQVRVRHLVPIGLVGAFGVAGLAAIVGDAGRRLLALLLVAYLGAIVVATVRYGRGRAGRDHGRARGRPIRRCTCRTASA